VIEQAVVLSRELYSRNGVPFVYAAEGETYASIADAHGLFLKEILRFNDASDGSLLPGTVVYLQAKKSKAAKGLDKHVVDGNETLVEIAQRYAVKLKKIYALNHLDETYVPREGDVLKLRK
jgi:LysM repeat protein